MQVTATQSKSVVPEVAFVRQTLQSSYGIDLSDALVIRHSESRKNRAVAKDIDLSEIFLDDDLLERFTAYHSLDWAKKLRQRKYLVVMFGPQKGATLFRVYKIGSEMPNAKIPDISDPTHRFLAAALEGKGNVFHFDLRRIPPSLNLERRLVVRWERPRPCIEYGVTQSFVEIRPTTSHIVFENYRNVLLTYDELKSVLNTAEWKSALDKVAAIYLITDTTNGCHYVGKASGEEGLYQRWRTYAEDPTGAGNTKLVDLLGANPGREKSFQFSILQTLGDDLGPKEIGHLEKLWKMKLKSYQFGYNDNL